MRFLKVSIPLVLLLLLTGIAVAQSPVGINYQGIARDVSGNPLSDKSISIRISLIQGGINGTIQYSEIHDLITNQFGLFTLVIGQGNTSDNLLDVDWSQGDMWMQVEMDVNGGINFKTVGAQQFLSVPYAFYASKSGQGLSSGDGIEIVNNEVVNTAPDQEVRLLGAGSVTVNGNYPDYTITGIDQVDDADADPSNEIQDLEFTNNELKLTNNQNATVIDLSAFELTNNNDAGDNVITNVGAPVNPSDAATKEYVDNLHDNDLDKDVNNEIQDLSEVLGVGNDAGGGSIKNIADPVDVNDAVNLNYVNSVEASLLSAINDADQDYAFRTSYSLTHPEVNVSLDDSSGDNFDNSFNVIQTNRFTAPVDGVYLFSIQGVSEDAIPLNLVKNGTGINSTFIQQRFPNASFQNYYGTFLLNLVAGDFVELEIVGPTGAGDYVSGTFFGYKL